MKFNKLTKQAIVRAIIQDIPPIDKEARALAIHAAIVKAMSPEVRKLFKTHPAALRKDTVRYTNPYGSWGHDTTVGDVTEAQIEEILKPYEKQEEERGQALTTFPEFKKYYPTEEEPTKNLPALANVMADLSKLGWPKK